MPWVDVRIQRDVLYAGTGQQRIVVDRDGYERIADMIAVELAAIIDVISPLL